MSGGKEPKQKGGVGGPKGRKAAYLVKAAPFFEKHSTILVAAADNVSSRQLAVIRKSLRGDAILLMGKNTLMRKTIRDLVEKKPEHKKLLRLLPKITGNVGLVFTNKPVKNIRTILESEKKGAEAKSGAVAPVDVIVPAGPTQLDPQQTQFMQALNIETKISRMKIEITSPVHLITKGDKVTPSQAELLRKLGIKPFEYGLVTSAIYEDGDCYDAFLADLTDEDVLKMVGKNIGVVTSVSLAIGYPNVLWYNNLMHKLNTKIKDLNAVAMALNIPTRATVPSLIFGGYKNLMGLAVSISFFPKLAGGKHESLASQFKLFQENPDAFKAAAPAATEAKAEKKPDKKEEKEEEEKKEDDADMDLGGLF